MADAALSSPDLQALCDLHPRFDEAHKILWLDLNHGKANEMGSEQLTQLEALADLLEKDASVRCLAVTSQRMSKKGKPIFIAGANVTERQGWSPEKVAAHVQRQRDLMQRLSEVPVFTVAITHGVTLGWGAEFLLAMDYAIATRTARIALPETGLGIIPGAGGTAHLAQRVGPAQALRLGCTGESLSGAQAQEIGLVAELVDNVDAGAERVQAMAKALAKRSPTAVAAFKQAVLAGLGENCATRVKLESRAYQHCLNSGQAAIGRAAFSQIIAGESPDWGVRVSLPRQDDPQ